MSKTAYLVLENGMTFEGVFFGAQGEATGEIVFTTGMTGYLETLTDQSHYGQIVLQTFPLIGNYGVIPADFQSESLGPAAYIVKHSCQAPSNFRSEGSLGTFLNSRGIVGIEGIDTRALTRVIRENGVMNGRITDKKPESPDFEAIRSYKIKNAVAAVTTAEKKIQKAQDSKYTVALMDFGVKESIKDGLLRNGCDVWTLPANTKTEELLGLNPDGIVLSGGPGDPRDNPEITEVIRELLKTEIPILGIGLGHQLLALANGFETERIGHGHRGANQPVRYFKTGRVYITNQNHGYVVVSESINPDCAREWFTNVNDGSCEGIDYIGRPSFSVQFCPWDSGGLNDTGFVFRRFTDNMEEYKNAVR